MKNASIIVSIIAILSAPLILSAQSSPQYYWYYYVIDSNGPVGTNISLVYDKNGFPAIIYREAANMQFVKLARFNGEEWSIKVIDNTPFMGGGKAALAFDSLNQPHIIYHAENGENIKYAFYDGASWKRTTLILNIRPDVNYDIALQIDSTDNFHMLYTPTYDYIGEFQADQLSYITFSEPGTLPNPVLIDGTAFTGKWNDLLVEEAEQPTAIYWRDGTSDLVFAQIVENEWVYEAIEESTSVVQQGYYPSMKRDQQNNYFISFQNQSSRQLRFAWGQPGAWNVEDIVELSGWTTFSTPNPIVLDEHENPIVAFFDYLNGDLNIAIKKDNGWYIEPVDTIGRVGEWASIALNSEGMPVISYYDDTRGYLRLAVGSLQAPADEDGDLVPDYIELSSGTDPTDLDTDDDGLADGEEDINQNGLIESYETDPKSADSDSDGILDGVEMGRTVGITAPPGYKGTDMNVFIGDADPTTRTDPFLFDTDNDRASDGEEDKNADGLVDVDESDPNDPDSDGDAILDGVEIHAGMSPIDLDSDDDGIADRVEDENRNGLWEVGETNPSSADSDRDGLTDGLETGIVEPVADPDGPGKLRATDLEKFNKDEDPSTLTDPLNPDSDFDNIVDGMEDFNHNGRFDDEETNPLDEDTDDDELKDGMEITANTDPLDIDSDDDGIKDGVEDKNQDGKRDENETSPSQFDSDEDGLSDGIEQGKTSIIADPDGSGPLKGTDLNIFTADTDSTTNSDPLLWDSDNDCLSDGEEDQNLNGAADANETHYLVADSDKDGLLDGDEIIFSSDPLDAESQAIIENLYTDSFLSDDLSEWTIVDEGNIGNPSDWLTINGVLIQTSNIWGVKNSSDAEELYKPGTYIWLDVFHGSNYKISFDMQSNDDDEFGVMFHYQDNDNYYRYTLNKKLQYQRIVKIHNGSATLVAELQLPFQLNRYYNIIVFVVDGNIKIYFNRKRIFDIRDETIISGSVGFYCWKNSGAAFRNLSITGQGTLVAVKDENNNNVNERDDSPEKLVNHYTLSAPYPNPTSYSTSLQLVTLNTILMKYRVYDLLGRTVKTVHQRSYTAGQHIVSWDGLDAKNVPVPPGIYIIKLSISDANNKYRFVEDRRIKVVVLN